jgi:hypothetical protein
MTKAAVDKAATVKAAEEATTNTVKAVIKVTAVAGPSYCGDDGPNTM